MPEENQSPQTQSPNNQPSPWISTVPGIRDEYKGDKSFTSYKDINGLLSSHKALEKMMGGSVRMLTPESTDEERNAFYTKLGRPESPDKYGFDAKAITETVLGKDFPVNEPFMKSARETFHKLGLNNEQGKNLVEWFAGAQKAAIDEINGEMEKEGAALKSEWGHAYDSNVALAQKAMGELASEIPELSKFFGDPRNANNPTMVKLFAFLGKAMGEDTLVKGEQLDDKASGDIKAELDRMMNDPKHPDYEALHNIEHGMHRKAVEKRSAMYKQLYPEG